MLRALRARGVSLDEVAVECDVSWWTVLRWMRGERAPHPDNLRRLTTLHARPHVSG
jgi:DNA-binding transcriptional regulator YiaG